MPSYIQLPNGKYMEVPEKLDDQQALELAQKKFPKMYGLEGEKGVLSGLKRSAEGMLSSGTAGIEALIGDETKAAQRALKRSEAQQQFYEEQTGLDLVKKAYEEGGLYGGAKEVVRQAPLAMAEFAPQVATSLGAARIGATGGAMVGGLPGAVVGGAIGAFAPSFLQQLGGNIERQVGVQREAGKPEQVDLGAALPAATGQGMLDMAGNFIPFGKGAVRLALGKKGVEGLEDVFGKRVATMLAKDDLQGAKKLLNESWKSTVAKGTATGVLAEVPTEVAQQMLERGQAGLDIMDGDALNEYLDTAYQMALISPFGIAGRYSDKSAAGKAREERYAALTGARAERAQARFEEEQAKFLASPEHLAQLEEAAAKEQAAIDKMQASLDSGKVKKPEKLQDKIADKQAKIASIQEQIASHPALAKRQEMEGIFAQSAEDQAQRLAEAEQRATEGAAAAQRKVTGEMAQPELGGVEPFTGPVPPAAPAPIADQRAELDNQTKSLSAELAKINARIEAQQKELAAAAAAGDTTKAMDLMAQAEKDPTAAYKAEIEKQLEAAKAQAAELKKADPAEQLKALQKQFVKAGDEGNFEAIKILAPQIEALKQQVPAAPAAEKPQVQQKFFTEEGQPSLFATQAVNRRVDEVLAGAQKDLRAQVKQEKVAPEQKQSEAFMKEQAEQPVEPTAYPNVDLGEKVGVPQKAQPTEGGQRVLGRPAQPMKLEQANERVDSMLRGYQELVGSMAPEPTSSFNPKNKIRTKTFGGYMDAEGNPVSLNVIRRADNSIARMYAEDELGRRTPVQQEFDPETSDVAIANEVSKAQEWTRPNREQFVAATEEAKNKVIDTLLGKADSVRMDSGLPRLDDQAATELAAELNNIIVQHTSPSGVAPQLAGRLSQAITRFAKQTPGEVKRGIEGKSEEFVLTPQTEAELATKVAEEEGAGKTNRSDTVSGQLQQAIDTKPTGAVRTVLEEAKRIVDTGRAPNTLLDEAESQALRIINGKTPQMRNLYDETVVAKAGKVTEEAQASLLKPAKEEGDIRASAQNFQRFLNSAEVHNMRRKIQAAKESYDARQRLIDRVEASIAKDQERKQNETTTKLKAALEQKKLDLQDEVERLTEVFEPEERERLWKALDEEVAAAKQDYINGMKILAPVILKHQRTLALIKKKSTTISAVKHARELRNWLDEAYALRDGMQQRLKDIQSQAVSADDIDLRLAVNRAATTAKSVQAIAKEITQIEKKLNAKPNSPESRAAEEKRRRLGLIEAAVKESQEKALQKKRADERMLEETTAKLPKTVSKIIEERISKDTIKDWKDLLKVAKNDLAKAERNLEKKPGDEDFTAYKADAELRIANLTKKIEEARAAGATIEGRPKGTTIQRRVVEQVTPLSKAEAAAEARAERIKTIQENKQAREELRQRMARGEVKSVVGLRNAVELINERLAEKNAKGQNKISGTARAELVKKRTSLNNKLERILKKDRAMVRISEKEEIPGGMITPQKIVAGKKATGKAFKAPELTEIEELSDEFGAEAAEVAKATLLREAGPLLPEERQVDLNEAQKRADVISAKLAKSGIKMEYYRSLRDAPAKVQAALKYHNATGAKGMIFPDGTVAVFGDMHESMRDLEETIAHEVIGHYGVESALGPKGVQALTDKLFETDGLVYRVAEALGVWNEVRATEQSAIARGLNVNQQRIEMVRELIAHTAEKRGVPAGLVDTLKRWVKLVVNAVRNMFANNGMTDLTKATTKEIQKLIDTAERQYIENRLPAYKKPSGEVAFRSQEKYKQGFNPKLQKLADKVIAKDKTFYDKVKANVFGLNAEMQFVDRWAGLEHILDKRMKNALAAMNVMYHVRGLDARNQLVAEMASNGATKLVKGMSKDGKTEIVMRRSAGTASLKDVVVEAGKSKRIGNPDAILKQLSLYMAAHRAKRVGIDVAFGENSGITQADLDAIIREGDADPHFKKARQLYAEYNKGLIEFLHQSGAISREEANELTRYGDYIGFYREKDGFIVDGEHAVKIGSLKDQKYLKELLGSDKNIVDFQTSSLQNTSLIAEIALRNLATKATINALQEVGLTVVRKGPGPSGTNVVRFKDNGKWYHAVVNTEDAGVPTDLFIKGLEGVATTLPAAIRFMQGPANLLRKGVTRMPLYAPRQIIRDSVTSVMVNGVDAMPVTSSLKAMWDKKTERFLQEQGWLGGQTFSHTPDDMKRIMKELTSGKEGWTSWMAKLDHLAIKADAAARITAFNSYIKQGFSEMEASLMAAETINFTKRGISPGMNMLSIMIPFFNAQVQGLNVLYRGLTGKGSINQRLNTQAKLFKRGALMAGMTMAYALLMGDDEAYKNATEEERYNNVFVYLPFFDEPIRVPIPFELGYIFKSLPEAIVNVAMQDTKAKEALTGLKELVVRSIPGYTNAFLPQALKPLVEVKTNYNFFTGKPLESAYLQALEPGQRRKDQTTALAASLGSALNVSPVVIDHLIYGYTGGLGAGLAAVLNPVFTGPETAAKAERPLSKMPFIGAAFQPTDGRGIINNANESVNLALQVKATAKAMVEDGRVKEAEEYVKENARAFELAKPAQEYKNRMAKLNQQLRAVQLSADMTPKEKGEALKAIQQEKIALAKQLRSIE